MGDIKTLDGKTPFTSTLSWTASRSSSSRQSVTRPARCGCRFRASTRSRVSVMSSPAVSSRAVKPGDECMFLPTHSASTACTGKVFTVEMHHKNVDAAMQGDNVGMNVKGLPKDNMPRVGDVMVKSDDDSIHRTKSFTAQVQVLNHPGELKVGYCPIAFIRTGRSAVRLSELKWKVGKETGGQKAESPISIKAGEMGAVSFEPQQP